MIDQDPRKNTVRMWLVIGGALALLVLVGLYHYAPFRSVEPPPPPSPASSEWTTEPEGPKIPVALPKTPITNVPAETPSSRRS